MTATRWFVYSIGPIDNWDGTLTLTQWPATRGRAIDMLPVFLAAGRAAGVLLWEGDGADDVRVAAIPHPAGCDFVPVFVWKQGNNGTTFCLSPLPLPHLGSDHVEIRP